jgi:hypothetical protein
MAMSRAAQFVRITPNGIILVSHLDPSANTNAYYLDLNNPPLPSQMARGSAPSPTGVRIGRAYPPGANQVTWSRCWDAVSPSWFVGEESMGSSEFDYYGGATLFLVELDIDWAVCSEPLNEETLSCFQDSRAWLAQPTEPWV